MKVLATTIIMIPREEQEYGKLRIQRLHRNSVEILGLEKSQLAVTNY